MSHLQQSLEAFRLDDRLVPQVTAWQVLGAREAEYDQWPAELDRELRATLAAQGIAAPYSHQAQAIQHALAGENVVIVTPTASGKTLCYNLPVLHTLLHDPQSRALYLFPTKALAHDQHEGLLELCEPLGLAEVIAAYDGDTPSHRRAHIRRSARILLSNPDMLHMGILPQHPAWRDFLANLRFVIIDELHYYRGIFGSHMANVLRRLLRLCRFYGSAPRFICCSATIANPHELAEKLIGQPATLVDRNGAPRGERTWVFYNPPIVNQAMGIRRQNLQDARLIANHLLASDVQTVVFARSRLAAELLLTYLRTDATREGRDPQAIRGYRGGYLPAQRREIERGLREGSVRCVVATNALELGVDIGGMDAAILVGYPGTIASTWQQAGRAGRGSAPSVAFVVAAPTPLDQYMIAHPGYFFATSPEHALVDPDNLSVLLSHVQCAAYELPFADGDTFGGESLADVLAFLGESGRLEASRGKWHWHGEGYPASEISLRTADPNRVTVFTHDEQDRPETLGWIDRPSAPALIHEGAIYWHDGQQYLVERLDWEQGLAVVEPAALDYYTEASGSTRIDIQQTVEAAERPYAQLAYGEVLVTSRVTGYRKLRLGSLEYLGWGEVTLPEQQLLTSAFWMALSDELIERLRLEGWWQGEQVESRGPSWPAQRDLARRRDGYRCRWCGAPERPGRQHHVHHLVPFREFHWVPGQNENHREANRLSNLITLCPSCHRQAEQSVAVQSTLSGLARVLGNLLPLHLMCDPSDLGITSDLKAPQTGLPTIFVFDRAPSGVGLCERTLRLYDELLANVAELVRDCHCPSGCPACVGPAAGEQAKQQVLRLISALQGQVYDDEHVSRERFVSPPC